MPSEKRRSVLFLPKWYPDRKQDQNGNFVQQHAYAVSEFANVVVLFANYDNFSGTHFIQFEFENDRGIPTYRFYYKQNITGLPPLDKLLKLFLYFVSLFRGYRMILRRHGRPDLLHVHVLLRTGLFAWFKFITAGIPYIITEHWSIYLPQNAHRINWLRCKLSAMIIKKAAALNTVSENLKQAMQKLDFRNELSEVIPNVVDTDTFSLGTESVLPTKTRFLHVAGFNEEAKNQSGLLRTMHKLSQSRQDFELRIVGFGPNEMQLKGLASEFGLLDSFVFFEGKKEAPEVAEQMQNADVFVLFSNFESLPCVLIEALASGLPVITTNVGGIPEMISSEQGILLNPGDETALLQALDFMCDNHNTFNKNQLRAYAKGKYSYAAVGRQFADLYETALLSTQNQTDVR